MSMGIRFGKPGYDLEGEPLFYCYTPWFGRQGRNVWSIFLRLPFGCRFSAYGRRSA
jgi:hypothetical protein